MATSVISTRRVPHRPRFDELPLDKNGPRGNIWGLFGSDDELGLLNYIGKETTRQASQEICTGLRIPVDLPLDFIQPPAFGRATLTHRLLDKEPYCIVEDQVDFNTQSSTQWDGFRHFAYQDAKLFYNGTNLYQIHTTSKIGTNAWVQNGGIATRGVLLDLAHWASSQSLSKPPFERTAITANELRSVCAAQGVKLRTGDVMMIRTGYLAAYPSLTEKERAERHAHQFSPTVGLEQSEDMLRFLWESGAVAVASDTPTLEMWPMDMDDNRFWLHEWLLAGWGCPIGEYFDLERLSVECQKLKRWTFFFSSMPLHVNGGVGTPVSGMAIF